jgi:hypothetical protein
MKKVVAEKSVALRIVKKFFPNVGFVIDAKQPLVLEVTNRDANSSLVRNHKACAMAVACKRTLSADGVIVGIRTIYVIKSNTATRFRVPEQVSREIVSFDRNAGFAPGIYRLLPPARGDKLGDAKSGKTHNRTDKKQPELIHHTVGIRTVLGSGVQ